jgi:hypothetical protein
MSEPSQSFSELIRLVQQGDAAAFERLMDEYSDAIKREVRFTLLDARLRRCVGESDVYQSVCLRFFSGLQEGRFCLESPQDLVRLLKGIARTRVAELVRFWRAQRRDLGRHLSWTEVAGEVANESSPRLLDTLADAELARMVDERLSPEDRRILDWRSDGLTWLQIATQLGGCSGDSVRKRHERTLHKLVLELRPQDDL